MARANLATAAAGPGAAPRCGACGQAVGAVAPAEAARYDCAAAGCRCSGLTNVELLDHCVVSGHAPDTFEGQCEACGRRRLLRGAEAAAAFRGSWVPGWHRRQARLLALNGAADSAGSSGGSSTEDG
ncbi:hypothetical protein Rsub_11127 [Raphidocelis subcapitata]|uniref:Uncharacterized protein n=1 Tax=Raphidocelis subcapitata TaxID=307507 RepID=A0A2V0PDU6_9CHLO|nr:hypothetical protein Rsub_11127 [Raphidocelis subcapitata]|eukprot:GBF98016.1 hypothetical protein Rsub_11127 [Raphidocelis subcapitata]